MKTLFAYNENLAPFFNVLTAEELNQIKGGDGPGDADLFWEDELNNP